MGHSKDRKSKPSGSTSRDQVQNVVEVTIATVTIVRDFVPLEPAKGALGALCGLLKLLQMYLENDDDLSEIAKRCQRVAVVIKRATESDKLKTDEHLSDAIEELQEFVEGMCDEVKDRLDRGTFRRALSVYSDSKRIKELKERLRDFLQDFQVHLEIIQSMNVLEILEWTKIQPVSLVKDPATTLNFLTPKRPPIFFGRAHMVSEIVDTVLSGEHVMLIGTGGMGKSSIAKAVLNEEAIVSSFDARLFITYDGVASSAMSYQLFLDRIATELKSPIADLISIIGRLEAHAALLVIDNAETLLEVDDVDSGRIAEVLDTLGGLTTTRIIVTTRNHASVSPNFLCKRITVLGISMDAACDAFSAVYKIASLNDHIRAIFTALDYHPLSINILANAATMNQWSLEDIEQVWSERQTEVLENANDKYRSLRVATEISIVSFKDKMTVLHILRAIAFLPQGIHRSDFPSIFPSIPTISLEVEALTRSSLIYRNGDRLTMLAPIRMYISDQYNRDLLYGDHTLSFIRAFYHNNLSYEAQEFVEREHGNINRLMHFDMLSSLYQSDTGIHITVLIEASHFLFCTSTQQTSLWPLLVSEIELESSGKENPLADLDIVCLIQICWTDYSRYEYDKALEKLGVVEAYCRDHIPALNERLMRCLRLKGSIFEARGNLILAANTLEEGSAIARAMEDFFHEALLNQSLAGILLLQGKVIEAGSLYLSVQEYFEAKNEHGHLVSLLTFRVYVFISQHDFSNARLLLEKAMEIDQLHNGGRKRLHILVWRASCEGWAGDYEAALKILQEATEVEVALGTSQFSSYMSAMRGRAYYEARMGNFEDARNSIAHEFELRNRSGRGKSTEDFMSALIATFAGERGKAISMMQTILDEDTGTNDKQITAIYHRTLGEVMLLEGSDAEAEAQFEQAKTICDELGISPKQLYMNKANRLSLVEYPGWDRFLDRVLQ